MIGIRLRAILYVAIVFACGMVAGAMVENWRSIPQHGNPPWAQTRGHILEEVKHDLVLTSEQSAQLETILDEAMNQFDNLHTQAHRVRQDARDRIRAILNEQQKQKFEEAMARLQKQYGDPGN